MDAVVVGARIKQRRKALGMSQKEVALCMELTKGQVDRAEEGKLSAMSPALLARFAAVLGVDVFTLWHEEGEAVPVRRAIPRAAAAQDDTLFHLSFADMRTVVQFAEQLTSGQRAAVGELVRQFALCGAGKQPPEEQEE